MSASRIVKDLLKREDFNILLNKCLKNYGVVRLKFIAFKDCNPYLTNEFFIYPKEDWLDIYIEEFNKKKINVSIESDFYSIVFKRRDLSNNSNKNCYILFDDLLSILSAGVNLNSDGIFETTLIPATRMVLQSMHPIWALIGMSSLNCGTNSKVFSSFYEDKEKAKREDLEKKTYLRRKLLIQERMYNHRILNDPSCIIENL